MYYGKDAWRYSRVDAAILESVTLIVVMGGLVLDQTGQHAQSVVHLVVRTGRSSDSVQSGPLSKMLFFPSDTASRNQHCDMRQIATI